ncbi:MAG: septal ring lytic transglycosylase RlpA family protein [Chloroflexi bacterium]|nr:septal ring lytic transglycosylase RlpA family protein [Chloroflexota bacterium]
MRHPRVAARAVLIAALALVAVPNVVGSRAPSRESAADDAVFQRVTAGARADGMAAAITTPDNAYASEGRMAGDAILLEPGEIPVSDPRVAINQPESTARVVPIWHYDREISFYGPGFYGRRTACGYLYTTTIMGVAHRTLPCGTLVTFRSGSRTVTVPVIDRGPYVYGRTWDLSGAACIALRHCWTGPIYWKFP